jgi:hypothetical protein
LLRLPRFFCMVIYEVTALVELERAAEYEQYIRRHIPELIATGCFAGASFDQSAPGHYRVRYRSKTREDLDRYLRDHAPRLRADFSKHFPSGVNISREVWETLQVWPAQGEWGNIQ